MLSQAKQIMAPTIKDAWLAEPEEDEEEKADEPTV